MEGSIAAIVTRGFGIEGGFEGSMSLVVTQGYGTGDAVVEEEPLGSLLGEAGYVILEGRAGYGY